MILFSVCHNKLLVFIRSDIDYKKNNLSSIWNIRYVLYFAKKITMSNWTSISEGLPGRSATNPNHSRIVLTCLYNKPEGTPEQIENAKILYDSWMREAYYDFTKNQWVNDTFTPYGDVIQATHWRELPAKNDPAWVSPAERLPAVHPTKQNITEYVLVVTDDGSNRIPITSSFYVSSAGEWRFLLDIRGKDGVIAADREVTHWMLLPKAPDQ
jgi:hypothetical protein